MLTLSTSIMSEPTPAPATDRKHPSIANRIRQIRQVKRMSQEFVAQQLGVSQKAYSKMENNETRLNVDTLLSLSDIFDTPIQELVSDSEGPIVNDFSHSREGDNVIYKSEGENINRHLLSLLLETKDEVIASQKREIELLRKIIERFEASKARTK